jgi:hypothetical protein
MHKCVAPVCEKPIGDRFLMCAEHWRKLPQAVQVDVYAKFATFNRTRTPETAPVAALQERLNNG